MITTGGGVANISYTDYTVTLTTQTTGELWVYSISLLEETSLPGNSWGSVKSIYKN